MNNKQQVKQSQLGLFIKLINEKSNPENILTMHELAEEISNEFNVCCSASDIEKFMMLDNYLELEERYEIESRKIEYYGK